MKNSVINIFEQSDAKAQEEVLFSSRRMSSEAYKKAVFMAYEKRKTLTKDNYEYERYVTKYIARKKKKMILRIIHTFTVDVACSVSSILTLLALLLLAFDANGVINLFYVVFCLVFIYQMKNFIYQKNWRFPQYLERLLKPFVFFEI